MRLLLSVSSVGRQAGGCRVHREKGSVPSRNFLCLERVGWGWEGEWDLPVCVREETSTSPCLGLARNTVITQKVSVQSGHESRLCGRTRDVARGLCFDNKTPRVPI